MLTCLCHAIYIKQRHLGAGVNHYRRGDTQSDNVTVYVTGLACAMASVRQMSRNVKTAAAKYGQKHCKPVNGDLQAKTAV